MRAGPYRTCYTCAVAIVWALVSASLYGVSDYAGGKASRRIPAVTVTMIAEVTTLVALLILVPRLGDPFPPWSDIGWGAAAGLAGVLGVLCLYRALADGAMSVVAPITAIVAAGVPVAVGLISGERPGPVAGLGIVAALLAVALISGAIGIPHVNIGRTLVGLSLLAGLGFGLLFVFYDRTSTASGWWPILAARTIAFPILVGAFTVATMRVRRDSVVVRQRDYGAMALAMMIGIIGTSANIAYLAATRVGLLSIVAVVVSMYPASTVLLATGFDGERLRRPQVLGLGLAALALGLVSVGG